MQRQYDSSKTIINALWIWTFSFLIMAIAGGIYTNSLNDIIPGCVRIMLSPAQLTRDYFELGGLGGCFLNVGLAGLISCLFITLFKAKATSNTIVGYFLVTGIAFFGINALNMTPPMLGILVYAKAMKKPYASVIDLCLFATSLSPFISEVLFRYPKTSQEIWTMPEFTGLSGIILTIVISLVIGFGLPPLCVHSQNYHKGYDLFNVGPAAGFFACCIAGVMFKLTGVARPNNTFIGNEDYFSFVIIGFSMIFLACYLYGMILNDGMGDFIKLLRNPGYRTDFSSEHGVEHTLLNMGVYGAFLLLFYTMLHGIFDARFTGPTAGAIICAFAFVGGGCHHRNVAPIALGYLIAGLLSAYVFPYCIGLEKPGLTLSTQAIVVGFAFATGMAPITGNFGVVPGIIAGIIHYSIVTIMPDLHLGFNLYNGGLTAGVVAFTVVPIFEMYWPHKEDKE